MVTLSSYSGNGIVDIATSKDPSTSIFSPNTAQVSKAVIKCGFNTWKTVTLTINCPDPTWYAKVMDPIRQNNTPLYYRIGMQNGSGSLYTNWEQHILLTSTQTPSSPLSGSPTTATITTADMLCSLNVGQKVIVRKGTISNLVHNIASAANISNVQVEPTNDQFTLYQTYMTDFDFIMQRLIPRAINGQGYGDYKLYISGGILYFSTLDFEAGTPIAIPYTSNSPVTAGKTEFNDYVWPRMMEGSAGTAITVANPYQSGKTVISPNTTNTLSMGGSSLNPTPVTAFQKLMGRHKGDNPVSEIDAQAQNRFSSLRNTQYDGTIVVNNNPFMELGSMIDVVTNQTLDYSGLYVVAAAVHWMESNSFRSSYTAIRDSATSTSSTTSLSTGFSLSNQTFGSEPSSQVGTAPRIGQTANLTTVDSGPTVSVPISIAT